MQDLSKLPVGRRKTPEEFAETQRRNAEIVRRLENPTAEELKEIEEGGRELLEAMKAAKAQK